MPAIAATVSKRTIRRDIARRTAGARRGDGLPLAGYHTRATTSGGSSTTAIIAALSGIGQEYVTVHIHEAMYDKVHNYVDMTWFPEQWAFGNGVTTNVWVNLRGTPQLVSWCVLSPQALTYMGEDIGAWRTLAKIMGA